MKIMILLTVTIALIACPTFAKNTVAFPDVFSLAQSLPATGVLKKNSDGYVYLSVSNQYKIELFPVLYQNLRPADKDCLVPNNNPIGEHITIFNTGELNQQQLDRLPIGKNFKFHILNIVKVDSLDSEYEQGKPVHVVWYVVQLESKELMQLTQGFGKRLYPLHISFAVGRYREEGECLCVCDLLHCGGGQEKEKKSG